MTEAEWLCCGKPPSLMLGVLRGNFRNRVSDRQLRLFICGCVRQLPEQLWPDQLAAIVEYAEAFADGRVSLDEVNAFRGTSEPRYPDDQPTRFRRRLQERVLAGRKLLWEVASAQSADVVNLRGRVALGRGTLSSNVLLRGEAVVVEEQRRFISSIVHDIFGNPFRPVTADPSWLTSTVVQLAEGIYADRAFDRLPILADALQDAGCDNDDVLNHCRQPGEHVRGCWVVDLLLGKS